MGASHPFRVRGLLLVRLIPLTRIAQARSNLSPPETFAQFPSPFDCRMTPRVIHFEKLIRKDCRWLSDWWDS
jgi:hypothetical protein